MESPPYVYDTLLRVLSHHAKWFDRRHRQTLAWMMVGLSSAQTVSLGAWAPCVVRRARYAPRIVRRLRRWLDKTRIKPESLSGPLSEQALVRWMGQRVSVAWETSMRGKTSCLLRFSVMDRGRAVPLVWQGIEHGSAAVSFATYKAV